MKKNIYICHTEYHFMLSLHIASTEYDDDNFENIIYITKTKKRFNNIHIPQSTGNITVQIIDSNDKVGMVRLLMGQNCYRFFFCQENSIYNRFIAYQLKKKSNSVICLIQDGYKAYAVFNKKHEFLSMIKDSLNDYKILFKNKLFAFKLFKADYYRYGSTDFLDEVWLTNVNSFDAIKNRCKAKLISIADLDHTTIESVKKYFNFSDDAFRERENIILYLNQPFWTSELIAKELEFLNSLVSHFHKTIYLKLHPATSNEMVRNYRQIKEIVLLTSDVPAEFYILEIEKSIIFSGWSGALITNNTSCNYYFNLPIYKNCGAKSLEQSKITILPHIKLINKPQEMRFPNE